MMTEKDISEHLAFYESLQEHKTRYSMGRSFTGRHTMNIGFSHPMGQTTSLFYRANHFEYQSSWTELYFSNALKKLAKAKGISQEELSTFQKHKHSLEYLLYFWKGNIPRLAAHCNFQSDIRQLAQLAVILNYQIP